MRAFALCALAVTCASEKPVNADNHLQYDDDGLSMLQWKMRRVSDKLNSHEDSEGGHCDLLVIPRDSSHDESLLRVTAYIEKMGDREEDLWIRRLTLSGQWLPQPYGFKTGSGSYGEEANYLVRMGTGEWKHPIDILKATDGLMSVAIHNKSVPTHNFESSLAQDVSLVIGPVTIGISYATSNKDERNFNHLDIHLKGLADVRQTLGGILAAEPPHLKEPNEDEPNEDEPNEDDPNLLHPNGVDPEAFDPDDPDKYSNLQMDDGEDELQLVQSSSDEDDELQLVQSSTHISRNTIYKMRPSVSSVKFDWCCDEGKCAACHWQ